MKKLGSVSFLSTCLATILLLAGSGASAAGFGQGYKVFHGDLNGDGRKDLLVKAPPKKVSIIPLDDLIVPIIKCCDTPDFVLQNNGAGSFSIVGALTAAQQLIVAAWPEASQVTVWSRDIDYDGKKDLELTGVRLLIADAWDMILWANDQQGGVPSQLKAQDMRFQARHEQLFAWIRDNNFFDNNAPLRVRVGGPVPTNPQWYAGFGDPPPVGLMNQWLQQCNAQVQPSRTCVIHQGWPPEPCIRTVGIYDNQGRWLFNTTTNICDYRWHILIYPNTIQVERDYSVYDSEARETAEIMRRLNSTCPAMNETDKSRLQTIMEGWYGRALAGIFRSDTLNSWQHETFPGDSGIYQYSSDPTFHHYDLETKICFAGQSNCTLAAVRDNKHRYYSFPNFLLRPKFTNVDGSSELAFITWPGGTSNPNNYWIPAGPITQRFVTTPGHRYEGATQNVTQTNHVVYPGTISRYVEQRSDGIWVFTHGIGINRMFCTLHPAFRPLNLLAGYGNDVYGPKAFGALDVELKKSWQGQYNPQGADPGGPNAGSVGVNPSSVTVNPNQ
jgi:hypothetical protein